MKGRRKVITCKWFLKAQFMVETQHMIACRSKIAENRFLDATLQFGAEHKPIGPLAGGASPLKPIQNRELAGCSPLAAALTRSDKKRRTSKEREREIVALARDHILACGDFLLVQDLANYLGIHVELLIPALKKWEVDHRIFSIDHDGCRFFPVYSFPSQGEASPIPGLKEVLSILCPMKDGWGVSFWFISPNGCLGGKRPQDLLSTEPSRLISAAHDEAGGVTHG